MWDCIIVGGGPAGLTAATYLGRFRREILLVDSGESRIKRIPLTRNTPGFPEGVAGPELLALMQDQAGRYGAQFRGGSVDDLVAHERGFSLSLNGETIEARTVLLATGAKLIEPPIAGLDEGLRRGLIRYCPICDGYEARGQRIAVLGGRCGAIKEAHFLRTYSEHVTYLHFAGGELSAEEVTGAKAAGISIAPAGVESISLDDQVRVIDKAGAVESFDVLYPCLGCDPLSDLAQRAGARSAPEGGLVVDAHQRTNVTGLYAAGDVLRGLDQIASACGQAAIAAVAIHNQLREAEAPAR
ncbi:NAD(P)/FAD-dependent oxidoreductase [Terricaulis sp.]|uniref:NAD(P)/FAD-dependent oxidoreductase n=1 Tax=Terricaulis sp. TaxID=2768686 RepID=UPI002AC5F34F|nr:NAD(P)/FAD-dependent oxidoreductase [Terricaulis sp.]MDZ4690937.1 NAD(P)/FAD-dependent oxidoreductase [Terricaulis sp.]